LTGSSDICESDISIHRGTKVDQINVVSSGTAGGVIAAIVIILLLIIIALVIIGVWAYRR